MNIRRDSPSPPSPRRSRALLLSIGTSRRGKGRATSMRRSTTTKRCIYHTLEFHPRSRPSRQANRTLSLGGFPYPFQERDALISPARKERMTPTPNTKASGTSPPRSRIRNRRQVRRTARCGVHSQAKSVYNAHIDARSDPLTYTDRGVIYRPADGFELMISSIVDFKRSRHGR